MKKKLENEKRRGKLAIKTALKETEEKKINQGKIEKYKNSIYFNSFKTNDTGYVLICPLIKNTLYQFKFSKYISHPMLKKIIDGAFWNYSIYGKYPNGKYIFMNSEKIIVYPPIDSIVSYEERINNNFFYKGLLEIKSSIKNEFGNCSICKHLWDTYYIGEDKFSVCKKDILIYR